MLKTILLLVLVASASLAGGQVYKWRDSSGATQYSDTPPPANAKDVKKMGKPAAVSQAGAAAAGSSAKSVTEQDAEFRKRLETKQEAETKAAKANEEEQARAANCEQAKVQLAGYEAGQRMSRLNAQGDRILLDDAEIAQGRVEAERQVATWCR